MFDFENIKSIKAKIEQNIMSRGVFNVYVSYFNTKRYTLNIKMPENIVLAKDDEIEVFLPEDKSDFVNPGSGNVINIPSYEKIVLLNNYEYGKVEWIEKKDFYVSSLDRKTQMYMFADDETTALFEVDIGFKQVRLLPKIDVLVSGWINNKTRKIYNTIIEPSELIEDLNSNKDLSAFVLDKGSVYKAGYINKVRLDNEIPRNKRFNSYSYLEVSSDFLLKGFNVNLEIDFEESFKQDFLIFKRVKISNLLKKWDRIKMRFLKVFDKVLFGLLYIPLILICIQFFTTESISFLGIVHFLIIVLLFVISLPIYIYFISYRSESDIETEEALRKHFSLVKVSWYIFCVLLYLSFSVFYLKNFAVEGGYYTLNNGKNKIYSGNTPVIVSLVDSFDYDKVKSYYRKLEHRHFKKEVYTYDLKEGKITKDSKVMEVSLRFFIKKGDYLLDGTWKKPVIKAEKVLFAYINKNPIKVIPSNDLEKEILQAKLKEVFLNTYLQNDMNLTIDSISSLNISVRKKEM